LVVTAPVLFGRLHVLPVIADFLAQFPEVNVRLMLGDRNFNLVDSQIDMAVRLGKLPDSGMIATRVGSMRRVVCGSPILLERYGIPRTPQELGGMPCVATFNVEERVSEWSFRYPGTGTEVVIPIAPRLATSAGAAVDAALRGVGFVYLRHYQVVDAVKRGKLRIVLVKYEPEPAPVHLIHATRGQMPLKMRRFLDFAAPRLRKVLARIGSAG
jgi:DNA-binding transcriptional LysR family regulator